MNVTIQTATGSRSKLSIANDCTVCQLKTKIERILSFSPNDQQLLFDNTSLSEDNKRLSEYGIRDGSVIHFSFYPRPGIEIFIRTKNGSIVVFDIGKNEKFCDIKKKLQKKIRLTPDHHYLVYQGEVLDDDKTVNECQIEERSVINVLERLRGGMQIFVKTLNGKTVTLEIYKYEKVSDIKKKVEEKIGLAPNEQKLVFQGGILEDDKTADEYQIVERSVINVIARLRNSIRIFAKTMDGMIVACDILKTDKIIDIKKKVQEKIGLAPHEQTLIFQGRILEDDKTADEYNIEGVSVINVLRRVKSCCMQVFVKTKDGRTVTVEMCRNSEISYIKERLQEEIGLAPEDHKLLFQGQILRDDKTAHECRLTHESVINVVRR